MSFEVFDGQRPLRSLFIDQRLTAWRDQLPQADNRQQRVTGGPFVDRVGQFTQYKSGRQRVTILLEMLGQMRPVTMRRELVAAIS